MTQDQPHNPNEREWIPVPPPHPYAQAANAPRLRGLAIAAMAIGLAAALTAVVAALYSTVFLWVAVGLGVVAAALGAWALWGRSTLRTASLIGLIAGAIAIVVSAGAGALSLGATVTQSAPPSTEAESDGADAATGDSADGDQQQNLLEWPANLATGGILFAGGMQPVPSAPLATGTAPTPAETHRDTGPADIRLYIDYRCPYCAFFEQANAPKLEELVRSGRATLEVVPLTFLDRYSAGTAYSSRAAGAVMCVVDGQPEVAWAAHSRLLSPETQPAENTPGLDNDEIAAVLEDATGGLSPAVTDCVKTGRFSSFASALGGWAASAPVPNAVDPALTVAGTPFVIVNGVPYAGSPTDSEEFNAFLAEQGL